MKEKLPQSHLVLLSFAKFRQFRGLFSIFFASCHFVSHPLHLFCIGAPYIILSILMPIDILFYGPQIYIPYIMSVEVPLLEKGGPCHGCPHM
jgi:hypothetical protein